MTSDATGQADAHWSIYERSRPDPNAPEPISPAWYWLYTYVARILYYLGFPFVIPLWLVSWQSNAQNRAKPLKSYLKSRMIDLWEGSSSWYLAPVDIEVSRWSLARPYVAQEFIDAKRHGDIPVEVIQLEPVRQSLRIGVGASPWAEGRIVPGFWVTPKGSPGVGDEKAKPGEKAILHFHGGAYIGGHPLWMPMTLRVIQRVKCRLLGVNYRKPVSSDAAFPTPLLDALTGYIHLTEDLGFKAESITFFGKSAGGHLCLMLSRYLHDLGLPQPGRIIVLAPWCDFTLSSPSYERNKLHDVIGRQGLQTAVRAATRWYRTEALDTTYFSPCKAQPNDWIYLRVAGTKVYMLAGTHELFYDEIVAVHKAMKKAGVNARLREDPGGLHTSVMWNEGPCEVFLEDVAEMMRA